MFVVAHGTPMDGPPGVSQAELFNKSSSKVEEAMSPEEMNERPGLPGTAMGGTPFTIVHLDG